LAQQFLKVAAAAIRGTVDGLLAVGFGEGVLLGIAYKLTGVPHPALLGLLLGPALLAVLIALWHELAAPEITHAAAASEAQSR
jgi:predicted PurR-regulated permease PerM